MSPTLEFCTKECLYYIYSKTFSYHSFSHSKYICIIMFSSGMCTKSIRT